MDAEGGRTFRRAIWCRGSANTPYERSVRVGHLPQEDGSCDQYGDLAAAGRAVDLTAQVALLAILVVDLERTKGVISKSLSPALHRSFSSIDSSAAASETSSTEYFGNAVTPRESCPYRLASPKGQGRARSWQHKNPFACNVHSDPYSVFHSPNISVTAQGVSPADHVRKLPNGIIRIQRSLFKSSSQPTSRTPPNHHNEAQGRIGM